MNALHLSVSNSDLTYVEGFAWGVIPVHHAWNVDRDGNVIDVTWKPSVVKGARAYFGVPFTTDYVTDVILKKGTYGVINDWENGYPILNGSDTKWQTQIKKVLSIGSQLSAV